MVAIVLLPWNVSKVTAAIWCVITLLPQALMAVLMFVFAHSFLPLLLAGLGFAGGHLLLVCSPVTGMAIRPQDGTSVVDGVSMLQEARHSSRAAGRLLACQLCCAAAPER